MAIAGIKLGTEGGFVANCFPVRYKFGRTSSDGSGAWAVAHHAEQTRRFKAVLCAKDRSYSHIKGERKKAEIDGMKLTTQKFDVRQDEADGVKTLDKLFLMNLCYVDDPLDLCSVNIAGKELTDVEEEDLLLFANVAYVTAGENFLPFESFSGFSALRELDVPLNGLRNLKCSHSDFTNLEVLDISYNNLSQDDLLTLGLLTRLKVLHLTGNNFVSLPEDLSMPYLSREKQVCLKRFTCLEVLMLDDNKLMDVVVFAALAGLPKLCHLDLSKNELFCVPQLKLVEGRVVTQDGKLKKRPKRVGSGHKSDQSSKCLGEQQDASLIHTSIESDKGPSSALTSRNDPKAEDGTKNPEDNKLDKTDNFQTDQSFQELMVEDFNTGDLSARITEFVSGNDKSQFTTDPKLPPFPELRYLNLADNKIYEEEGLLPLAAWPMLESLDVYNNPLTTKSSGDPPLLKRFLQERLGIQVNRVKPQKASSYLKKGKVEIRPKHMKISESVPKIPKTSLEEQIMLQLTHTMEHRPMEHRAMEHRPMEHRAMELEPSSILGEMLTASSKKPVLPPIPGSVTRETTEHWTETETINEDEEENQEYNNEEQSRTDVYDGGNTDSVFMTQPHETSEKHSDPMTDRADTEEPHQVQTLPDESNKSVAAIDDRYQGYELLLDIVHLDNEPELPPAKDIQGNIRALNHTLNHLLVYRDPAVELNKVQKMVQEYRRVPIPPAKPHRTYQEKVDDVLTQLKNRSTMEEENLATVLQNKGKSHKQFPEAERLLGRVQRRYNTVRYQIITEAKQAGDIAANVLELLSSANIK